MSFMFFASSFIFISSNRKRGVMSTSTKSSLRKSVTIPEMSISVSQLIDILEFSRDRHDEIKSNIYILERALKSEYIDRQPVEIKDGIESAIKEATSELSDWHVISNRLQNILHDALND